MERVRMYYATVYNAYCPADSRTRLCARTREELWTKILDGQRDGLYGSVLHTWDEEAVDPDAYAAEQAELRRIRLTTCPLPPESDLRLIAEAKRTDPADFDKIDPDRGSWKVTRSRLERIRSDKHNEHIRDFWAGKT